jgi:hypothetical protein
MGFFDWFKRNVGETGSGLEGGQNPESPEVPRELFVDDSEPNSASEVPAVSGRVGVDDVFAFMRSDLEDKGYHHALSNPDDSYRADNIRLIRLELRIRIEQAKLYYSDRIKEIEDHIESRARAGLHDLARELEARKKVCVEHLAYLSKLLDEIESEGGVTYRAVLSYQAGFKKGLAAITQAKLLSGEGI